MRPSPHRFRLVVLVAAMLLVQAGPVLAQPYDLLIKGGHVIDPKNGLDGVFDVAIDGEVIARVAPHIAPTDAATVVDAAGYYVTPGLIDIHAHVFVGSRGRAFADGFSSVSPDDFTFRSGVTTIVDAGTSGWRNFPLFKEQVIDRSTTRVLAFLNIVGRGMWDDAHNQDVDDMDVQKAASTMQEFPEAIVGIKLGHFAGADRAPLKRALEAAERTSSPLLVECHLPELPLEELLQRIRPGDIFTHAFGDVNDRAPVVDESGRVRDYVLAARDRGILFDVGHGGGSFHFSQAVPAMEQGLLPETFGTDLHRGSMNAGMKNMLNIMSKYLNIGMELSDVVSRATWRSAKAIGRDDLGHLSEGAVADLAVLSLIYGKFGFVDAGGYRLEGDRKLEAELTVRGGRIVWDLNGIAATAWAGGE